MKKSKDKVKKPEPAKTETTTRGEVYDWMQSLVFALIICILVFVFLFRIVDVSGDSMNPTLTNGDKLVVSDVFYKPKQGDIVIFRKGCVFVMGDNRNASSDSRKAEIGMVDERLIVGKVLLRVFPLDSIGIPDGE